MLQIAGSEDILLFCAFVFIAIAVSSLCKSWLGALIGLVAGIADIIVSYAFFSIEIFSLSSLVKLLCLCFTGFFTGHYCAKYRAQRTQISRQREQLTEFRLELNKYASLVHDSQESFSRNNLYGKALETLRNTDPAAEELIWIIIRHMLESGKPTDKCMEILLSLNPRIMAVIRADGRVITYHTTVMALFGYSFRDRVAGRNILELLQAQDAAAASAALKNIHEPGFSGNERYAVKILREQFIESIVFPTISFKPAGSGQLVFAEINSGQAYATQRNDPFLDMAVNGIWWIDAEGKTDFITGSMAHLFGYLPDEMYEKKVSGFLNERDTDIFFEILNNCSDGEPRYQRLDFLHKNGSVVTMQIRTHSIFGASRRFMGLILTLEDPSNQTRTEKALFYRLSMEEMIADISSRFVGIKYKSIDGEIVNSLNKIEEFMGVRDSSVQLTLDAAYREKASGTADVLIWQSSSFTAPLCENPGQPYASEESLTIPLLAGTRSIGVFRCTQNAYTKEWMGEDIRLIQLAGEIFINAITGRENQLKLILSEERLRVTLNSIGDAIIAVDENNVVQMFNSTSESLIGINKYNALGKYLDEIFITHQIIENPDMPNETAYTALDALDGQSRYISAQRYPITDTEKKIYGEIIIFSDVSEKKRKEDEIRYISFHDSLTSLYNRVFFEEEMRRLDVKRQYPITIIMGDCNGLKITNDVFGHYEGDRLLVRIAEILMKSTRKEDVVARWGGDEFVIILPKTDEKTASHIRDRILTTCENSDMHPVKPNLALGSATKTDDSQTLDMLLKEAEERMYRHKLLESKSARNSIIASFEKMLYERNYETEEHAKRMQDMAHAFGLYVGLFDDELDNFCLLAALHDIGKIGIPDNILLKPGQLSSDEWTQMKKHSEKGFSIANSTGELNNIADLILYHHERWDGTGYPQGLRGEEIPKLSRMLSIIDAYDVITHSRPYKAQLSQEDALFEIEHCASTQFDPALVRSFILLMRTRNRETALSR